jgi:phosphoribosylformylglycinamidine synthase
MPVYRIYVEKKSEYAIEAHSLHTDIVDFLGIASLESLRILNRYDVEGISETVFQQCRNTVFAEPQVDNVYNTLPRNEGSLPTHTGRVFAIEPLPGQYDQRSDSCAQCIQMATQQERPLVKSAQVYLLTGTLTDAQFASIKKHVINPVESREAELAEVETLVTEYNAPPDVPVMDGFRELNGDEVKKFCAKYGLAMDEADLRFCRDYFLSEGRDPTLTEVRMIDTYWSDHCRHTTFSTVLDDIEFENSDVRAAYGRYLDLRKALGRDNRPVTLMDMATIGAQYLKHTGTLTRLDESEEINACSVYADVDVDGKTEPWLLMFKNETHNHPTEIEPFGGAATCIGGAIRDPLAGRAYVYQAMRITGAGNPLASIEETLPGKLPQRKLVTTAAAGYSSYGNQIGLATGLVHEIYHPGYHAKHMELGAVVGAAPVSHVVREHPEAGDVVILLGGRTGRDGCGGATGSSKSHTAASLEQCGAEVQKGNAPEERKLQRLFRGGTFAPSGLGGGFRNGEVTRIIKRCNDFGAGGVSVAIGELAEGLEINLDAVPKKYEGLDGTELAISESQERMAVVVAEKDVPRLLAYAAEENLEATPVARVTNDRRLRMNWRGKRIVDISREFLDSNGAEKHAKVFVKKEALGIIRPQELQLLKGDSIKEKFEMLVTDLNICSQKGLSERFDSTIGAGTVLMPFGGKYQMTPVQAMAALFPVLSGKTTTCSLMAFGCNPFLTEQSPYHGAYLAVAESVAKIIATGGQRKECYLTFQEYFERLENDPERWGKPTAALLGALDAQIDLGVGAIGGKDSMSGSFENIHVPPTFVSFAVSMANVDNVISPEFKKAGSTVALVEPKNNENGLPEKASLIACLDRVEKLIHEKKVLSVYTVSSGGIAEALFKMCLGNRLGFHLRDEFPQEALFGNKYGAFVLEFADGDVIPTGAILLGETTAEYHFTADGADIELADLQQKYEAVLQPVYPYGKTVSGTVPVISYTVPVTKHTMTGTGKPRVFIPVFPGTNCEYDTARALERAGAEPVMLVVRNLTKEAVTESIEKVDVLLKSSQIMVIPGGFSGGDEPDGSGKFITAFFRNPRLADAISDLLENRDGLVCGICNGFQALIKLGLVPFGKIVEPNSAFPTLTFNTIGRHQSMLVRTRIASNKSPWLISSKVGDIYTIPVSHGEGRFVASESVLQELVKNGQVAAQYVDLDGKPTMDGRYNPNGSVLAIEAIISPDGRVLGKMGHSERRNEYTYKNVPGNTDQRIFENAVRWFK